MRYPHIARSNINLLASFQALIEERSITRAAARMFLSQPAMSRVLDKLQEMFNDKLLVRTRKGFEPTRQALRIYNQLERALPEIEGILRGEKFNPSDATDHFRISMTDHVALVLLPALMKVIVREAPGVGVEVLALDGSSFQKLETNALDLVIRVHEAPSPLRSEPIYRDKNVCLIRKGHPLGNHPLTTERYLQLDHLIIALEGSQQGALERALSRRGHRRIARLTMPFFTLAGSIIETTDMAATLPSHLAKRFSANTRTRSVPISLKLPDYCYTQVWHPRNDEDPAHVWLRQIIRNTANRLTSKA
jgi:DNA-binding transcriptional LysR family regulator